MSQKRKQNTLTLLQKNCKIVNKLDEGESSTKLSIIYKVGKSTIRYINKSKEKIFNFGSSISKNRAG